jgi:predicted ATP-dependent serine protease
MILDMKKLTLIFIAVVGLGLMFSCEKKEATPVYDPGQNTAATIMEPAADLAVCCSIASSFKDKQPNEGFAAIGEVGLGGFVM